jgi:hypothetical protein
VRIERDSEDVPDLAAKIGQAGLLTRQHADDDIAQHGEPRGKHA